MDATLTKKLNAAKAAFKNARTTVETGGKGDFFTPEPGRKKVQVTDGEVNESQAGRLQAYLELTILEGEEQGESFRKYYGLDDKGMEFMLKDLQRMEFDLPDDIGLLPATIEAIVKAAPMLSVRVKEKGEYLNTYFDKLLKGEDAPAKAPVAPAAAAPQAPTPAPAPQAAPAPEASETNDDEIRIGKKLAIEGLGIGTVKSIDESTGTVVMTVNGFDIPVTDLGKLSIPPAEAPAPSAMRVTKK